MRRTPYRRILFCLLLKDKIAQGNDAYQDATLVCHFDEGRTPSTIEVGKKLTRYPAGRWHRHRLLGQVLLDRAEVQTFLVNVEKETRHARGSSSRSKEESTHRPHNRAYNEPGGSDVGANRTTQRTV